MEVTISDLVDLGKIADSGQCFRASPLPGGGYRFIALGRVLDIRPQGAGRYQVSCGREDWEGVWRPYFDLGRDYRAVNRAIPAGDAFLQTAAREGAGIRILRQDPWETLATFILSQRKSIPAIRQGVETLSARYGAPLPTLEGQVYAFPTPEQLRDVGEADYRACKAGYRAPYLCDAVGQVLSGRLDLAGLAGLPDDALLAALEGVRGVGVKVASCVALFAYGRAACAPVDTWIKRIIQQQYQGRPPFARYGGAAGIMQQYFFYYALNHKREAG